MEVQFDQDGDLRIVPETEFEEGYLESFGPAKLIQDRCQTMEGSVLHFVISRQHEE